MIHQGRGIRTVGSIYSLCESQGVQAIRVGEARTFKTASPSILLDKKNTPNLVLKDRA